MMKIIIGNWKQNGNLALLQAMVDILKQQKTAHQVGILPPFVYLTKAHKFLKNTAIQLGAQNLSATIDGAYTGEVSAAMLKEVGCTWVLVGHSERRQLFQETNETVALKFIQAKLAGLTPILCVGESLAEYEQGQTQAVIRTQLDAVVEHFKAPFILAYEPVWAIGTGKAATAAQAEAVHQFIRHYLSADLQKTPILYGGSVKPENAQELMQMPNIDGVLVGGAALNPATFSTIIG